MTPLDDLIAPGAVLSGVHAPNKRQLLGLLAEHGARLGGADAAALLGALLARERESTTATGGGAAIPHARLAGVPQPFALLARLAVAVDFDALDGAPVDLVVLLVSPDEPGAEHLKALARLSRALRDPVLTAKLRGAANADALYALLGDGVRSQAA